MGWFSKGSSDKTALESKEATGGIYEMYRKNGGIYGMFAAGVFSGKNKARGVSLYFLVYGNAIIYIMLISLVLLKPEIMASLGLEPFVQYMMHVAQPGGYENLVQQSSPEFATRFFHFHVASMLIFSILTAVTLIIIGLVIRPSRMGLEDCIQAVERTYSKMTKFRIRVIPFLIVGSGIYLYYLPFFLEHDHNRFPANNYGIGTSAFGWALYTLLFQCMMVGAYVLFLFRWWPKFQANRNSKRQ